MRHFLVMTAFAFLAAVVFGTVERDSPRDKIIYALKVFAQFMIFGLVLAWVLYFLPL